MVEKSDKYKLLVKGFLSVFTFFLFNTFGIFIIFVMAIGVDVNNLSGPDKIVLSVMSSIICLAFILALNWKQVREQFSKFLSGDHKYVKKCIGIFFIGLGVIYVSNLVLFSFNGDVAANESLIREQFFIFPLLSAFQVAILAPIIEEIVFRLSFKNIISDRKIFIWVSGIIFGLLHIQDFSLIGLLYIVPYSAMGVAFSYMYSKYENVYIPMVFHFINNLISVLLLLALKALGV